MLSEACLAIDAWLSQDHLSQLRTTHSPQLALHVATCLRCQTTVTQLLVRINPPVAPVAQIDCATCQAALAAYAEILDEHGVLQALQHYPHLWLHLWSCATCTEQLQMILALREAEQRGILPPLPFQHHPRPVQPPRRRDVLITFPRQWLATLLTPDRGPTLGDIPEVTTLIDAERGGFQVRCTIARAGAVCSAEIWLEPPVKGELVLLFGAEEYRTLIAENGMATIEALPTALWYSTNGPDVTLAIEPIAPAS
jgi:hypothetical protein